jgi:geranylgeranyl diphosphate synthase type II
MTQNNLSSLEVPSVLDAWLSQVSGFDKNLSKVFTQTYFQNTVLNDPKPESIAGSARLAEAVNYALFSGGKRFRPMLTFASCQVLEKDFDQALAWAMAVECLHTYSLIHDDLPCMDDDQERRGQPTVHIKFDEATALLAGDALLTEAFGLVGQHYSGHKNLGQLIQLLSQRSGFQGMVAGQANDLANTGKPISEDQLLFIHLQKTAALISAASLGPFLIFDQDTKVTDQFNSLSLILGLLFQLKDDYLDANDKIENNSIQSLGSDQTQKIYDSYIKQAHTLMEKLPLNLKPYKDLIAYNDTRTV